MKNLIGFLIIMFAILLVSCKTRNHNTILNVKKIDGDFGPGSKGALQIFKKDNILGDNFNWDLNTQKRLFKNLA